MQKASLYLISRVIFIQGSLGLKDIVILHSNFFCILKSIIVNEDAFNEFKYYILLYVFQGKRSNYT